MGEHAAGRFAGRKALVTGAGRGIGRATALMLAHQGASVVVNDVNASAAAGVVAEIEEFGGSAHLAVADITDPDTVASLASEWLPDILVNNAGGVMPGSEWSLVAQTTDDDWDKFLLLNLTSAFYCSRAVLPSMLEKGRGHIVSVGSISGTNGQRSGAAYAAAKAGLVALVSSIAKEYGAQGISSNGIIVGNAPFPTRTPERQAELDSHVHLARVGTYEEFASAIAFLCSEESSYLSGAMIPVDGGFHRANSV